MSTQEYIDLLCNSETEIFLSDLVYLTQSAWDKSCGYTNFEPCNDVDFQSCPKNIFDKNCSENDSRYFRYETNHEYIFLDDDTLVEIYYKIYCDITKGQNEDDFRPEFFYTEPNDVAVIECHGDKCRRQISLVANNVWCESCHGEFTTSEFKPIMKFGLKFTDIPMDSIKYIVKKVTPINLDTLDKYQMKEIMNSLDKMKDRVDRVDNYFDTNDEKIERHNKLVSMLHDHFENDHNQRSYTFTRKFANNYQNMSPTEKFQFWHQKISNLITPKEKE
jgi:hypothetical protein